MSDDGEMTERRYVLKCKTKFFRKSVNENINGKQKSYERKLVLLIPQDNDQRTRFLMAWLPDTTQDYYEVSTFISRPVDGPARMSVHRADDRSDRHYLFVMSVGAEEVLAKLAEGSLINVEVMKGSEDSEADFAADPDHDHEVV